jgi:hypothetical protein
MLFPFLLLVIPIFLLLPIESSLECQNQIHVKDLLQNEGTFILSLFIQIFNPFKVICIFAMFICSLLMWREGKLVTTEEKRPFICLDGSNFILVYFPFNSSNSISAGEVIVQKALALTNSSKLILALTLEQDSLWVGRICEGGKSQSAFLSDQYWF